MHPFVQRCIPLTTPDTGDCSQGDKPLLNCLQGHRLYATLNALKHAELARFLTFRALITTHPLQSLLGCHYTTHASTMSPCILCMRRRNPGHHPASHNHSPPLRPHSHHSHCLYLHAYRESFCVARRPAAVQTCLTKCKEVFVSQVSVSYSAVPSAGQLNRFPQDVARQCINNAQPCLEQAPAPQQEPGRIALRHQQTDPSKRAHQVVFVGSQ